MERGRGYLMSVEQKDQIIRGVHQACSDGARQRLVCDIVGINAKTLQRWVKANSKEFANLPLSQIVSKLADKGEYIAS
jgi:transposase-like protein